MVKCMAQKHFASYHGYSWMELANEVLVEIDLALAGFTNCSKTMNHLFPHSPSPLTIDLLIAGPSQNKNDLVGAN
jgi:hypothetical protein